MNQKKCLCAPHKRIRKKNHLDRSQCLRTSEAGGLSILVLQYASDSGDFVHFNRGDWQMSDNFI